MKRLADAVLLGVTVTTLVVSSERRARRALRGERLHVRWRLEADITPYDIRSNDRVCPSNVAFLDHTTWLRLDVAGAATIRVHGRVEDDRRVEGR